MCVWVYHISIATLTEGNSSPYSSFFRHCHLQLSSDDFQLCRAKTAINKTPKNGDMQNTYEKTQKMLVFCARKRRMLRFFLIQPARLSENWMPDLVLALEVWLPVWPVVWPVVLPLVSPVPTWKALEMAAKPWSLLQRQEKEYPGTLTV